ncbi:M28 family peptidase [Sphingobium boeckii]|nr:M28 family peptidase [Sphingobium boeckii]
MAFAAPATANTTGNSAPIETARLADTVQILASDAFEGRAPGTAGEDKTVAWLIEHYTALGLEPGGENGGWTQTVPLIRTRLGAPSRLAVTHGKGSMALVQNESIYLRTPRAVDRAAITQAEMVFVGYGVDAPERQWDDFKGVDLHGKIAVFLVNDPDFEAIAGEPVKGKFGDQAMTYYGRWTYKFEEAARRGAIGALIVHDTPSAGYGWSTVIAGGGENYDIVRPASEPQRVMLQGWIEGKAAVDLFTAAGQDLAALRIKARRADFKPIALKDLRFDADFPVTMERIESRNVLAKLTGTKYPDETIMFGAHWDAYGVGAADADGRTVRAGANDDALGLAGVIELARIFAAAPRTERTLVFAAWTAEEAGLLGSETYGVTPLYPLEKTVANLTLDILQTAGLARDVVLVGKGQNALEVDLAKAAALQGRIVTAETLPERGLFYRADHFSLARRGVPVLLLMGISGGADLVEGGRAAGDKWVSDYTANCYHKPCDRYDASWNLAGAAQDIALFHTIGADLANSRRWPDWNAASEFRAIRVESAKARQ